MSTTFITNKGGKMVKKLKVREARNEAFELRIDSAVVGKTPPEPDSLGPDDR